jgi:NitT/TauT family transport system substrate-binding protein
MLAACWRRRIAGVTIALFVVLAGGAHAGAQIPGGTTLRIAVGPVDVVTPLLHANAAGIFKKYGLTVEIIKLNNGPTIAAAVAGGSADLGVGSALSLIQAYTKGVPFTAVGSIAYYDAAKPDDALIVPAGSAIRNPKDLEGKTLATVSLDGLPALGTFAWLDAQGIDRSTIKYIEIPPAATVAALDAGRVDGAVFYEPFFSAAMAAGKNRVVGYPYDAISRRFAYAVTFGDAKWVREHGDAIERFLRATGEASAYVMAHETESMHLIAEFAGLDPAAIANMRHSRRGVVLTPGDLQPLIDVAAKYKFIPRAFPAQEIICPCAHRR